MLVPRDYEGTLFQHQALAAGPGREKEGPLAAESGWKHRFRVVQVGAGDFTAIQCGSGRTVTVRVPPRVAIEHAAGLPDLPSRVLAPLQQGDTVHIKGAVDGDDTVLAKRITVLSPGSGSS